MKTTIIKLYLPLTYLAIINVSFTHHTASFSQTLPPVLLPQPQQPEHTNAIVSVAFSDKTYTSDNVLDGFCT